MDWPALSATEWNGIGALAGCAGVLATGVVAYLVYRASKRAEKARRRDELFKLIQETRDPQYLEILIDECRALLPWRPPRHPPWRAVVFCVSDENPLGWHITGFRRRLVPRAKRGKVISCRASKDKKDWLKFDEWADDRDRVQAERLYRSNPVVPLIESDDDLHAPVQHHSEIYQAAIDSFKNLSQKGRAAELDHPSWANNLAYKGARANADVTPLAELALSSSSSSWAGTASGVEWFLRSINGTWQFIDMLDFFIRQAGSRDGGWVIASDDRTPQTKFGSIVGAVAALVHIAGPRANGALEDCESLLRWSHPAVDLLGVLKEQKWLSDRDELELVLGKSPNWQLDDAPLERDSEDGPHVYGRYRQVDAVNFLLTASVCAVGLLIDKDVDQGGGVFDPVSVEWIVPLVHELPPCRAHSPDPYLIAYQEHGAALLLQALRREQGSPPLDGPGLEAQARSIAEKLWSQPEDHSLGPDVRSPLEGRTPSSSTKGARVTVEHETPSPRLFAQAAAIIRRLLHQ